jgi:hypothetical protein
MPLVCRICHRANPAEAHYCYHDGAALEDTGRAQGPVAVGAQPFHSPFVFPSGKSCRNFDELVLACDSQWDEAREVLRQGYLESFLGGLGRADLARAARAAAQLDDGDRALDELLVKLPAGTRQSPRLLVKPLEINLGQLSRHRDQRLTLEVGNQGMGLLTGSISSGDDWLSPGDTGGATRKLFQCRGEQTMPIRIVGKCLRAGLKPIEGRLNIESNGGGATVIVRAEVPVHPYPDGVLAGARSPREVASKAKVAPKEAAVLFEKGAVAAWYAGNGWIYPVQGPPASGLGAIQQFFEALGLTSPPKVEISTTSINLYGPPGALLEGEIKVQTAEKRPVFAHASTGTTWLQVGPAALRGNVARIPVRVPAVPDFPGQRLQGRVQVIANGNQRFSVEVALAVAGDSGARSRVLAAAATPILSVEPVAPPIEVDYTDLLIPPAPAAVDTLQRLNSLPQDGDSVPANPRLAVVPVLADFQDPAAPVARVVPLPEVPPSPPEVPPVRSRPSDPLPEPVDILPPPSRWLWHVMPALFLGLCLLIPLGRDLLSVAAHKDSLKGLTDEALDSQPRIALRFHDREREVKLGSGGVKPVGEVDPEEQAPAIWEPSMRFGLSMRGDQPARGKPKRLTFEEDGLTNNTVVKLDGHEWIFGDRPFRRLDGKPTGEWPGRWDEGKRDVHLQNTTNSLDGRRSSWLYDQERIEVTQTVEIVRGPQSGLLDTCLVRYKIHNHDRQAHWVGLRFLLDTFIGSNDGVPFLIPGSQQLCATSHDFRRPQDVPDFIQACEKKDLSDPGTIAQVGLRLPGLETPSRVTLGAWPNPQLEKVDPRCLQEKTLWEVPVLSINTLQPGDSAVTIYWDERRLEPGQSREVGFTYGLGSVSAGEGAGKLALTAGGSFVPRGEFTVTAYVTNPTPGQTVKLELPEGFEFIDSAGQQSVPPLPAEAVSRHSPVTWKVRGPRQEGRFILKVQSNTGLTQTLAVKIQMRGIFE